MLQQVQKKQAGRLDQLVEMIADVSRRLPQGTYVKQDEPCPGEDTTDHAGGEQPDDAEDQNDSDSNIKWSDTDDDSDNGGAESGI